MKWKAIIAVAAAVLLGLAGVVAVGVWPAVRDVKDSSGEKSGVDKALAAHEAQLRTVPGVTMLGTCTTSGESSYIIVKVKEITPEVRAAVPEALDGYRVVLEKDVPPTSPPVFTGEVTRVKAATAEQEAAGLAGSLVVAGDYYSNGLGSENADPRTLTVRIPSGLQMWRPMGEGKHFIAFAEIRPHDRVQVTLTERLAKGGRAATAADVEVY